MKVYQCNSCGRIIADPHRVKLQEFTVELESDWGMWFTTRRKRKVKVHLCKDCFKGLQDIAKRSEEI